MSGKDKKNKKGSNAGPSVLLRREHNAEMENCRSAHEIQEVIIREQTKTRHTDYYRTAKILNCDLLRSFNLT